MVSALEEFVAASPLPQRVGLRVLLALSSRPRGAALIRRVPPLAQAVRSTLTLEYYDRPEVSRSLGFDADAVIARGRALRRAEGRP